MAAAAAAARPSFSAPILAIGRKIVAVGRNYAKHAQELNNAVPSSPILFLKPTSSYIAEGRAIEIPSAVRELQHEVELGVVIGKDVRDVPAKSAFDCVAGYVVALDMTARCLQNDAKAKGLPWTVAKGYDTFCPVSRFISKTELPDPHNATLWLKVNGKQRQHGSTSMMLFRIPQLISHISTIMTLNHGDLILTGTPEGVGQVLPGDVIEAGLDSLVSMTFPVVARVEPKL